MLEIEHVTKSFGGVEVVSDVSLTLKAGEMRAIIGPNGCGKTTLFNLVTGYLKPDAGRVVFEGRDIAGQSLDDIARLGIVRKFQVPSLFEGLSVNDNLRIAGATSPASVLPQFGLQGKGTQLARNLAHGNRQWLELAMTVAAKPKLLLLDEPAAGMSQPERTQTISLLKSLQANHGLAIMLIEHDMKFVDGLECPVSVMNVGKIIAAGDYDRLKDNAAVREAYLGVARA